MENQTLKWIDPNWPLEKRLRELYIRHYDELIHEQSKEWLIKRFSKGATKYKINTALFYRNIIWQIRERILKKQREPLTELIRTFWYMYIKPTLSRSDSLATKEDQYAQINGTLVSMVKAWKLMEYKDIGFRDENQANRKVGGNANIILFAEKLGHQDYLTEIGNKYSISTIALGGQPSVLNTEYFVDNLKKTGLNIQRSFYLFSIVDYDTTGWIIRDAFLNNLYHYGIKNIRVIDLVYPDMLTEEEIKLSRYLIPAGKDMTVKNENWLKEVYKRNYKNQKYLEGKTTKGKILYGLEAESITTKRLTEKLEEVMVPLIGKSEDLLRIYELKKLNESIKALIVHKVT
ncbi:MAG: hypothetical protein AUJ85_01240 [Elusimicrobia bacterium CG1_02_37_114]|nr:MAG: hypothetical protein AUJ85_01240 [Elusimicrobia bacterium CG1_02_37_114]PIV53307.1 MAG: hypothetical protein COS17_04630 [Elusimicrobia bacterium CG02_land_8_20_14_3_00_37_13]